MSIDQQVESTGQRVKQIMDDSPAVERTTPEQEAAKVREQMRHTMAGMEAERKRLGNFCVSIGPDSGQADRSRVLVLAEPVPGMGTYSSSMNYIVATDRGFMALRYFPSELEDSGTRSHKIAKENMQRLKQAIAQAAENNGVITTEADSGFTDRHLRVIQVHDSTSSFTLGNGTGHITEAETELVEQALQSSINAIRERNDNLLNQTTKTLAPAEAVQKTLGIEPAQSPTNTPPARKGLGGFFFRRGG